MAVLPLFLTDPQIGRHLLRDEGEVIVDEVGKHWVVYLLPALVAVAGFGFLIGSATWSLDWAWLPMLLGLFLLLWAGWKALSANLDRFVITNMRVFRVNGVLSRSLATMPLGRILGYGHFTFESAAQDQGLRDIRFVGRPDERDLSIQRVVQRSGLRGPRVN